MTNILKKENNEKKLRNRIEEFDEPLEQPGRIFLAEIHGSAQRLLKIRKLSKYIRFCKCCLLPSETTGVVIPYSCLDNKKDFGLGIFLYFQYIKFCILITFISLCLSSIPTMVFSIRYSNDLEEYCKLYYLEINSKNMTNSTYNYTINEYSSNNRNNKLITHHQDCLKYLSMRENNKTFTDLESIISNDWIIKMSADNIKSYFNIFKDKKERGEKILNNILIDFSFVYFLTGITLIIINIFYVQYFNMLDDADNFEDITPGDFTILVHGVRRPKEKKNIPRKEYLMDLINEISKNYFTLEVHQIIPCYNLVELYKLTKQVFEDRTKIYHANNFKKQKVLEKKYNNSYLFKNKQFLKYKVTETNSYNTFTSTSNIKLNPLNINTSQISMMVKKKPSNNNENDHFLNINYYKKYCCYIKVTPIKTIQERINKNNQKIKEIEKDINDNPNKHNCGTYFVIFKYIKMRDKIYDFFPTNLFSKLMIRIKYIFQNILFNSCVNEKSKRENFLKLSFRVEHATEAYEVLWKNLGFSYKEKYCYLIISIIVTIILIIISLCVVLILNNIQYNLTKEGSETFWKYVLSFFISIIIAITNSLGREILKRVTSKFETIETKTGYYISLSTKITFFTFINTAFVPFLSNYIRKDLKKNEILLNNVLMIFITNFALNPFFFYIGPELCLKLSRRAKARLDLEGVNFEDSLYTQGELNGIFENPKMDLCYKYSFYENILLTSLFYMSIFPLGSVFGMISLIFSYFLETYYLGYYKRPELLNARLCKFFIHNFKIVIAVFYIGNYIFLFSPSKFYQLNWSLFNFIFFIALTLVPYHSFRINFLGTTEGDAKKGCYEDYELMFPTDYEKQNPLTKKEAMIKYFTKLRQMNLIDKYQSIYLINNVKKESIMDNYYKTSKNPENILNSYEFQRQFLKSKKKYKFIKKIRQRKIILSQNENGNDSIIQEENNTENDEKDIIELNRNTIQSVNTIKEVPIKNNDDNESINNEIINKYDVNALLGYNKRTEKKTSQYMRATLFQQIKNEGIYDESEEEKEDDSFESEENSYNLILNNKKENFDFSLISNNNNKKQKDEVINNDFKKFRNESDLYDKKSNFSLYSIKTNFKEKENKNTTIIYRNKVIN